MVRKSIVLLSGGLDSATALYWAKSKGFKCFALTFDYGQKHVREINAARSVARAAKCPLKIISFNMPWGGSSLLAGSESLPKRTLGEIMAASHKSAIPSTYVPGRNTIFLAFAASYCDAIGAGSIVIGANAIDFSGYPDCRPRYYKAWREVLDEGTRLGAGGRKITIHTPLLNMSKKEIVLLGSHLHVPWKLTWSCYSGKERPCGWCDSCQLRAKGFQEAGIPDPLI